MLAKRGAGGGGFSLHMITALYFLRNEWFQTVWSVLYTVLHLSLPPPSSLPTSALIHLAKMLT